MKEEFEFFIEEILPPLLIMILITAISIGFIMGIVYFIEKNIVCPRYSRSVNLEGKYDFWSGGCFVKYEGQWIPDDNLRAGKFD